MFFFEFESMIGFQHKSIRKAINMAEQKMRFSKEPEKYKLFALEELNMIGSDLNKML